MDATAAPDSARMVRLVAEARSRSQAARLLKTLVFAGAYLGGPGCGGQSRAVVEEGGAPGSGGTATDPAGMGGLAGSTAGGRGGEGSVATAGYTGDIEGCPSSQRVCACTYMPPLGVSCTLLHPFGYLEGNNAGYALESMTCECDGSRPAAPEACMYTQQFTCAEYGPEYEECTCNPAAPRTADDCFGHQFMQCAGTDPMIGCDCITPIK
jgi:hypothetical protein